MLASEVRFKPMSTVRTLPTAGSAAPGVTADNFGPIFGLSSTGDLAVEFTATNICRPTDRSADPGDQQLR